MPWRGRRRQPALLWAVRVGPYGLAVGWATAGPGEQEPDAHSSGQQTRGCTLPLGKKSRCLSWTPRKGPLVRYLCEAGPRVTPEQRHLQVPSEGTWRVSGLCGWTSQESARRRRTEPLELWGAQEVTLSSQAGRTEPSRARGVATRTEDCWVDM